WSSRGADVTGGIVTGFVYALTGMLTRTKAWHPIPGTAIWFNEGNLRRGWHLVFRPRFSLETEGGVDVLETVCWLIREELIREINGDGTAERFEAFNHHFAVHGGDDGHQLFDSLGIPHGPSSCSPATNFDAADFEAQLSSERSDEDIKHRSPARWIGWSDDKL